MHCIETETQPQGLKNALMETHPKLSYPTDNGRLFSLLFILMAPLTFIKSFTITDRVGLAQSVACPPLAQ